MIAIAKNAGFCFGVKRAANSVSDIIQKASPNTRIFTLGELIHNPTYLANLAKLGVVSVAYDDIPALAKNATEDSPAVLLLRTHGISMEWKNKLLALSASHPHLTIVDTTCPFVKRIQHIAKTKTHDNTLFIVFGSGTHPEVQSILSYAKGEKYALASFEEVKSYFLANKCIEKSIIVVSQTTQNQEDWKKTRKFIENLYTNAIFFDTICDVTEKRQREAAELSKNSDCMIVIGGKNSANTSQLFHICASHCPHTYWIESADEIPFSPMPEGKISITAGASTPVDIIMEVYHKMSMQEETMSFEEMLDGSLKSLHTGDVVTGVVTVVSDQGIYLDLGAKVTGFIDAEQVADDYVPSMYKIGDEIKVFVIHVDDNKGVATLSKKRVDQDQNWFKFIDLCKAGEIVEGTIEAAVKGGLLITIGDQKAFIPASHTGLPHNADPASLVGTTQLVKLIDINEQRRRALASIRLARSETKKAEFDALWASLSVGQHFTGKVKNLTTYGAFVDIGGIDGMVHNSELSWKRIKHPSQVVSVGDEIEVFIKELDEEKKRISLGYKTEAMDTWSVFAANHQVGDVIEAKITTMMPFGAFAEVFDGVEGLIHISRIAMEKIAKPEDKLSVGEVVRVKITEINHETRKISLSIRALLEEAAKAEAEAQREAEKAAAAEAEAAERARMEEERAEMAPYIVGSID